MNNLHTIAYGKTYTQNDNLDDIISSMSDLLQNDYPSVLVMPEYCWKNVTEEEFQYLKKQVQSQITSNQLVVLGTYPYNIGEGKHNYSVIITEDNLFHVPKSYVLKEEKSLQNVNRGEHPGTFRWNSLTVSVLVCGDLWRTTLVNRLLPSSDLLLIPAMTTVQKGLQQYAQIQWYSLVLSRSREFILPIVVADHDQHGDNYDVGKVTCIADPSLKHKEMTSFSDFLSLPKGNLAIETINLDKIQDYRNYRREKGLYD